MNRREKIENEKKRRERKKAHRWKDGGQVVRVSMSHSRLQLKSIGPSSPFFVKKKRIYFKPGQASNGPYLTKN